MLLATTSGSFGPNDASYPAAEAAIHRMNDTINVVSISVGCKAAEVLAKVGLDYLRDFVQYPTL